MNADELGGHNGSGAGSNDNAGQVNPVNVIGDNAAAVPGNNAYVMRNMIGNGFNGNGMNIMNGNGINGMIGKTNMHMLAMGNMAMMNWMCQQMQQQHQFNMMIQRSLMQQQAQNQQLMNLVCNVQHPTTENAADGTGGSTKRRELIMADYLTVAIVWLKVKREIQLGVQISRNRERELCAEHGLDLENIKNKNASDTKVGMKVGLKHMWEIRVVIRREDLDLTVNEFMGRYNADPSRSPSIVYSLGSIRTFCSLGRWKHYANVPDDLLKVVFPFYQEEQE